MCLLPVLVQHRSDSDFIGVDCFLFDYTSRWLGIEPLGHTQVFFLHAKLGVD